MIREQTLHLFRSLGVWLNGENSGKAKSWKRPGLFLQILLCCTVFCFCTQVRLPVFGGRLALADPLFLCSFLGILVHLRRHGEAVFFPLSGLAVLSLTAAVNIFSCPGPGGVVEIAQLMQMVFGGMLLLGFFRSRLPLLCSLTLFAGLCANLLIASGQWALHGFGSVLAPADVMSLSWGFGHAYTGLFRSRMAFAFFLALLTGWFHPRWLGLRPGIFRMVFTLVFLPVLLHFIPHGQILLLLIPVLLFSGALLGRRALTVTLAALGIFFCSLQFSGCEPHRQILAETLSPVKNAEYPGELKTRHLDFIAALRLAAMKPWCGAGAGRYQQCIGRCYRELPNPSYNDINTDSQAGWGILCAVYGFPAAFCWGLFCLGAAAVGIRRYIFSCSSRLPGRTADADALGGAALLLMLMAGMLVSDALTRGLGWMAVLGLVSAMMPPDFLDYRPRQCYTFWRILVAGGVLVLLLAAVASRPAIPDPLAGCRQSAPANRRAPAGDSSAAPVVSSRYFQIVLNPSQAREMTRPFEKYPDSQTAEKTAYRIPDGKGTPPKGKNPAMEYGGLRYEIDLPENLELKVWLRTRWDGSCGNTLNVQFDDEKHSITAGNDGTYHQWHWVEAPRTWKLTAGRHQLRILNREDGIALDQIMVTTDMQYYPQGIEKRK